MGKTPNAQLWPIILQYEIKIGMQVPRVEVDVKLEVYLSTIKLYFGSTKSKSHSKATEAI